MLLLTYLVQSFNEAALRSAAVVIGLAMLLPRVLYFGFRSALVEATGMDRVAASVISGFVIFGVVLALLWLCVAAVRRLRLTSPSPAALGIGAAVFWSGIATGVYFVGMFFYIQALPGATWEVFGWIAGAAIFYPALGWLLRHLLGGPTDRLAAP